MNPYFFTTLRYILAIITPIVDEIAKSEGDHCHIGQVIPRWNRVNNHLISMSKQPSNCDWQALWPKLEARRQRQITEIHRLAYWLLPTTILNDRLPDGNFQPLLEIIQRQVDPSDFGEARTSFLHFYGRRGPFAPTNPSWDYAHDEIDFWMMHMDDARVLSNLADRLWHTLATEVPSERAFSALQIAKSKTRNRLADNRVDKLLFVQMNLRALDRRTHLNTKSANQSEADSEVDSDDNWQVIDSTPNEA
jgi:hypothetical protein